MKVLTINGSPRKYGSTQIIIDKFLEGMIKTKNTVDIKRISLGNMDVKYCAGCKKCYETGTCGIEDDLHIIIKEIINTDLIIVGSPSYWGDVTGQLKVFFDRNTPFSNTNENQNKTKVPTGKKGISIAIRAGTTEKENIHIIETIEHYYGHLGIDPIGHISIVNVNKPEDLLINEDMNNVYKYGMKIGNSL